MEVNKAWLDLKKNFRTTFSQMHFENFTFKWIQASHSASISSLILCQEFPMMFNFKLQGASHIIWSVSIQADDFSLYIQILAWLGSLATHSRSLSKHTKQKKQGHALSPTKAWFNSKFKRLHFAKSYKMPMLITAKLNAKIKLRK